MLYVQVLFPGYYHWSPCPKQHAGYNPAAFDLFPPSSLHLGKPSCLFSTHNLFALAFHVSVDSGVFRVSQSPGQLLIVTWDPQLQEIKIIQRGEISTKSFKETHTFLSLVTAAVNHRTEIWRLAGSSYSTLMAAYSQSCLAAALPFLFFFFLRRKFSHTL